MGMKLWESTFHMPFLRFRYSERTIEEALPFFLKIGSATKIFLSLDLFTEE